MRMSFSKNIYPQEALVKAAYMYSDRLLFDVNHDDCFYYVEMSVQSNIDMSENEMLEAFKGEVLMQTVRYSISTKTKSVRELILARAFASSLIDESASITQTEDNESSIDLSSSSLESILTNWFDKEHEQN